MRVAPGGLDEYRATVGACFLAKADIGLADDLLRELALERKLFAQEAVALLADEVERVLGEAPTEVEPLDERGTLHVVFRVETRSGRIWARTSLPVVPWPALDFQIDEWVAAVLPPRGVPVAETLHVDLTRSRLPFDFELIAHSPGTRLPPGPGGESAVRSVGRCLARVHTVPGEGWGPLDPGSLDEAARDAGMAPLGLHGEWLDYLLLRLDGHLAHCVDSGAVTSEQAAAMGASIDRSARAVDVDRCRLLHGDLASPNLLMEGDKVEAVLDWEDALCGDPIFDLAGWGTFVGNQERLATLLEGYSEEAPDPRSEETFGLRYWLYYLRIMIAKTVHRERFGYSLTDRIPAGERLLPALDALERVLAEGA